MAGLPQGLTPQMIQAIQSAVNSGVGGIGNSEDDTAYRSQIGQSLQNSGVFDPSQLAPLEAWAGQGSGTIQDKGGGNTGAFESQDAASLENALAPVLAQQGDQSIVSQFAPNPNTASSQALAGGYNPLQPTYLGQPGQLNATTVNPSFAQTSQLSPQLLNSLGSQNTQQQLQQSVAPQYNQQDQQMMQMLATAGLSPSSTAGQTAFNNLAQQQLAGISPAMASAIQNSQANQLNAGQYDTSAQNSGNQFNANTGNTAATYNANAMNAAAGTNLANQNQQQLYNANAANSANTNYFNALTGSYNNNANAFNALNTAGLSGAQNLGNQQASSGTQLATGNQNTFPTYGSNSSPYGALGAAIGGSGGGYGTNTQSQYTPPAGSYDPAGTGIGTMDVGSF